MSEVATTTKAKGPVITLAEIGLEKVKVDLFKDNDNYKDDVFVSVNFEAIQIQRGKEVEIPRMYAEVLENSMKADNAAANRVEKLERQAKEKFQSL